MKTRIFVFVSSFLTIAISAVSADQNGNVIQPIPDGGATFLLLGVAASGLFLAARNRFKK